MSISLRAFSSDLRITQRYSSSKLAIVSTDLIWSPSKAIILLMNTVLGSFGDLQNIVTCCNEKCRTEA